MTSGIDLFTMALHILKPWHIVSVNLDGALKRLDVSVDFDRGSEFEYIDEETNTRGRYKAYDTVQKNWRHLNFFEFECHISARVPRVKLPDGGIRVVQTPWEGLSSGFTLMFEAFLMELLKCMTVHQTAKLTSTYDNKLWNMIDIYTRTARVDADYSEVDKIGVDETSVRKNHNYITTFVDLGQRRTLYATKGKDQSTIKAFVDDLKKHQGNAEQIRQVACDMSASFVKGVEDNLPQAEITFDKFHIVKVITEAVDKVRREEAKSNPILKSSRFVLLKNQKNLTEKQRQKLFEIRISKVNLKTLRSYDLKESFQQIFYAGSSEIFKALLNKWYFVASHSRIIPMIEAARTIKRHIKGIGAWFDSKISNGILEGFNSLFQAAKAKARGYKLDYTAISIVYLLTAKLDYSKINPFCR
ncbi:MAG: hypothetical protein A2X11_15445 [Bacteroidetes bacterium GWE2_42_24]|nr:MAG: hypothetical protein A2X11_15445 [Bacteroidetes bacterium GWE2_42_24]